ncbi:hypothetical protein GS429_17645 [Natronorubrum sp. JWXQ-INN-674]|uniref:Uncharacterized protein n=1 Tax=Natronorubrum halalkaliphilum TaxID=2691917 RepID=A0A6B0VRT9_9EURY|nr:hypothetical protein [Natronorubrum halalkaliphilum]MXV63853.1 hypothetical protein [Natronorubrum halalkaliphilum]
MDCNRRRALELSGLAAVGSITLLAGCGDEGPGVDDGGDPGAEEQEDPTGGHPEEDHEEDEDDEDGENNGESDEGEDGAEGSDENGEDE